jgi:hypothetical protein
MQEAAARRGEAVLSSAAWAVTGCVAWHWCADDRGQLVELREGEMGELCTLNLMTKTIETRDEIAALLRDANRLRTRNRARL